LKELIERDGSFVVSTGGGIVLSDENRMLLKREKVIYLKVSLNELKRRVRLENRPLLGNDRTRMDDIYEMRKNLYEEFETLDTTHLGEWETVAKILYTLNLKDLAAFKESKIDSTVQDVHIEFGGLKELPSDKYVFTCEKVVELYGEFLPTRRFVLPNGERAKDISHVLDAYEYLLKNDVTRNDTLIGVGGGTVTDFTGFVGSTYKRGMNFTFYPTTLLASIDAAIGGKNGIDFAKYKKRCWHDKHSSIRGDRSIMPHLFAARNVHRRACGRLQDGIDIRWRVLQIVPKRFKCIAEEKSICVEDIHKDGGRREIKNSRERFERDKYPKLSESGTYVRACVRINYRITTRPVGRLGVVQRVGVFQSKGMVEQKGLRRDARNVENVSA